jgi:glycosyltransferase involved in cell wall biosynthesis
VSDKKFTFVIVTPCYNAAKNINNIADSLLEQTYGDWIWIISDDESTDNTLDVAIKIVNRINGRACLYPRPGRGEKRYALKNICNVIDNHVVDILDGCCVKVNSSETIIAIIDGDDQLCNPNALQLIADEYENGHDVVWTAHKWDVNESINVSGPMPNKVNPYLYQWCSSHFRTFRKDVFDKVNQDNFKDIHGNWFERGYDQALMLPILSLSKSRKYIDKVCYQYNINSVSMDRSVDTTSGQLNTVKFVRARGLVK